MIRGDLLGVEDQEITCRRLHLHCNGVKVCEHFDDDLLATCERYGPDEDERRALWQQELDMNTREASSATAITSR